MIVCERCGEHVRPERWDPTSDDHMVDVQGPLSIEHVAVTWDGRQVRYRTVEPYIVVRCSELDRTLTALAARRDVTGGPGPG